MPHFAGHDDPRLTERAILHLLVRSYPAQLSDDEVVSQISRDPGGGDEALCVTDALRQLQADQLIRRYGRCWVATHAAVRAYALLEN